jgi:predicted ATPase
MIDCVADRIAVCGKVSPDTAMDGERMLLGRDGDLAILQRAFLDGGVQLATLVGPGGIGKTTLASAYARTHAMERPGVLALFVDLAGAASVAELFDRVIRVLGSPPEEGRDASVRVTEALSAMGEALLVLDEFDQLVPFAVDTVGAWLEACPSISVLVTSRARLNIAREHVHEVASVSEDASRQILFHAAQRVRMDFALGAAVGEEEAAREVVLMLEGMPLALELAGARLPIVGAGVLRDELKRASALELQRATRDAGRASRHLSVDAAVRSSWDALNAEERNALAQLTVFRGGFTFATAGAVVQGSSKLEELLARSLVRSVARSLVRSVVAVAGRFDLYAQIRELVVREAPAALVEAAAERHAAYFSTEAERESRDWLIGERENVIEVARRLLRSKKMVTAREAEAALRAVCAAKDILLSGLGGSTIEIAELVAPLVERTRDSGADPKLSARVLLLRGALRRGRGEVPSALKDVLAAESIARAVRDDRTLAEAALEIGKTLRIAGEVDAAHHSFDRAQRLFAADGLSGRVGEGEATAYLASIEAEKKGGDRSKALALAQRAVAIAGNDLLIGARCHWLVARIRAESKDEDAGRSAEEALRRSASSPEDEGRALCLVALIAHDEGDLDRARLTLERALHDPLCRGHLGVVSKEQGRAAEAYALLSEASARAAEMRWRAHASYFDSHLAMLERSAGRPEAADEFQKRVNNKDARDADVWWSSMGALGARLLQRTTATNPRSLPHDEALVVGEGAQWFRAPGGKRVGLERRKSLSLVLNCLANANPGETFRADVLYKAGWPGIKAQTQAAAHSVRVAIATLRKMGLKDLIITTDDGAYGLSTSAPIVRL